MSSQWFPVLCVILLVSGLALVSAGPINKQKKLSSSKLKQVQTVFHGKLLTRKLHGFVKESRVKARNEEAESCNIGSVFPVLETCMEEFASFENISLNIDHDSFCNILDQVVSSSISCIENIATANPGCTGYTDMFIVGIHESMNELSSFIDCTGENVTELIEETCDANTALQEQSDCTSGLNNFTGNSMEETCRNFESVVRGSLECLYIYAEGHPECFLYTDMFLEGIQDAVEIMSFCELDMSSLDPSVDKCNMETAIPAFESCMAGFSNVEELSLEEICATLFETIDTAINCFDEVNSEQPGCEEYYEMYALGMGSLIEPMEEQCSSLEEEQEEPIDNNGGSEGSCDDEAASAEFMECATDLQNDFSSITGDIDEVCQKSENAIEAFHTCLVSVFSHHIHCEDQFNAMLVVLDITLEGIREFCPDI